MRTKLQFQWNSLILFLFAFSLAVVDAPHASAQAKITADKDVEFDAFAAYTYIGNAYDTSDTNNGATFGGDYTHFIKRYHGLIIPSFQMRGTLATGSAASEKTLEGGLKLATTWRRLHPYGDFMLGGGVINFPPPANPILAGPNPLKRDSSFLYIYGGGITYDVKRDWSAMVDYQHQYWDLGKGGRTTPLRFYPQAFSFGVVYHIPFKPYKHR